MEKLVVIGLGLIGGSLAKDLKLRMDYNVYGIDKNINHIKQKSPFLSYMRNGAFS